MSTTTALPAVGQRVVAVNVPGAEAFNGKRCTLTSVSEHGILRAEFQSPQKPDDTVSLTFSDWAPVFAVGDTVRVVTDQYGDERKGKIGTVEQDDESILPYWVTGLYPDRPERGLWMTGDQIEAVSDGQTLTVSVTAPPEGALVKVTGHLGADGIIDGYERKGRMVRADKDLWTVWTRVGGEVVSGPGYVTMDAPNPPVEPGDRVVCLTISAIDRCIGKEGVVESVCAYDGEQYLSVRFDPFMHEDRMYRDEVWNVVGWDKVAPLVVETDVVYEASVPKRELDRANERVAEYAERAAKWERDFNTYAERIKQEAIDRGWCSNYEDVMESIKGELEVAEIPDREREFEVSWTEVYTVTVFRSTTVNAADAEDAQSQAEDYDTADTYDLREAITNGNYTYVECENYEASEA